MNALRRSVSLQLKQDILVYKQEYYISFLRDSRLKLIVQIPISVRKITQIGCQLAQSTYLLLIITTTRG